MLFDTIRKNYKRFLRDSSGVTAIIFGLASMVLFMMAGAAVDFSQALSVRQKLSNALDAAALAVASTGTMEEDEAKSLAEDVFYANFPSDELGTPGELTVNLNNKIVSLSATASVDTAFLGIIGTHVLNVGTTNEVTREGKKTEIVMVLDNTGSMSGSKMNSLKTASNILLDIVIGPEDDATSDTAKIGIVPFAAAVNVGADRAISEGWIDENGQSSVNDYNFQSDTNVYQLWQDIENTSGIEWGGCVMARDETMPNKYDVKDAPPVISNPETLWVPYLYPDEPDNGTYYNRYSNDYFDDKMPYGSSYDERQRNDNKYSDSDNDDLKYRSKGPNHNCPTTPIQEMTGQRGVLSDVIADMTAQYTTNIAVGLAWGWRVVSQPAPFSNGAASTDDDYIKFIVLLTDGDNFISSANNHNESDFTAYNFVADGRLGTTTSTSTAVDELDNKTAELCSSIKSEGIRIYTVTFKVSSYSTKTLMKNCASVVKDKRKYWDSPSESQLPTIFGEIARDISNTRLSK